MPFLILGTPEAWGGLDTLVIAKALVGPMPRTEQVVRVYSTRNSFFISQPVDDDALAIHLAFLLHWNASFIVGMSKGFVRVLYPSLLRLAG